MRPNISFLYYFFFLMLDGERGKDFFLLITRGVLPIYVCFVIEILKSLSKQSKDQLLLLANLAHLLKLS